MSRRVRSSVCSGVWGLWLVLGCAGGSETPPQTSGPVLGDAGTSPTPETTSSMSESSEVGTDSGVVDDSGGTSTASGVDSTGSVEPGTDESSGGGPPPVCPPEPDDVPCVMCGKASCCAQYLACLAEQECSCALDCYLAGGSTSDCILPCGATVAALDLFNCAASNCDGICE